MNSLIIETLHRWRSRAAAILLITTAICTAALLGAPVAYAQSDVQWARAFASTQDVELTSMSLSAVGEVFIAGTFHGTIDFDPGPNQTLLSSGPSDTGFIAKYDPLGNLVWAYRLIGTGDVRINDIVVDPMAQVGVTGSFEGRVDLDPGPGVFEAVSQGGHDIFLLRLLPDGNLQWAWTEGNDEDDMGFAVATDSRSALYVTGMFEGGIHFESALPEENGLVLDFDGVGGTDVFAARFNNAGFLSWAGVWGGDEDDAGTDLDLDGADNVFVVGTFAGEADIQPGHHSTDVRSHGRDDIFVSVMTVRGDPLWTTYMGGSGNESNAQILVEDDGSFFVSGEFESSADFDVRGDGGVIQSRGQRDIFIARFGPPNARAFQYVFGIGGSQVETLGGLAEDGFGNLYVLGTFGGTVDFDPGGATNELTSSGAADIFVAKYGTQTQLRQVQSMENPQDDRASAIAISSGNNVLIGGEFIGTLNLGSGLTVTSDPSSSAHNIFVARYARDVWTFLPERAYLPGIRADVVVE